MVHPICDTLYGDMLGNSAHPSYVEIRDSCRLRISDHCSCGNIVAPDVAHCQAHARPAQTAETVMTLMMCGEITGPVAGGWPVIISNSNICVCKCYSSYTESLLTQAHNQHVYCQRLLQSVVGRVSAWCNSVIHIVHSLTGSYSVHSCTAQVMPGMLHWVHCGL